MQRQPNTTTAPTGSIAPFGLRMLPELREKVEAAARENGRSMNAEIVSRLEQSFAIGEQSSEAMAELRKDMASLREEILKIASLSKEIKELENPGPNTVIGD